MGLINDMFGSGAQQALVGTSLQDHYKNHMQHLRAQEDEMMRQKYAMQAQMNQSQNAYTKNLAQSMAQTKQAVMQNVYSQMGAQQAIKPFNPNEESAYTLPLSQLVTLWQAKYGDEWVEVFDDKFWANARLRLHNNDKLEVVSGWFRIKEDA